jgi:hypothetical protein
MEGVPKNKRFAVKTLLDMDPSLKIEELSGLKIVELLQKVDEYKVKAKEVVAEPNHDNGFRARSALYYCGLKN